MSELKEKNNNVLNLLRAINTTQQTRDILDPNLIYEESTNFFETLEKISLNVFESDSKTKKTPLKKFTDYVIQSAQFTLNESKSVLLTKITEHFLLDNGDCGIIKDFNVDTLTIKPEAIDFFDVLRIDPSTNTGKLIYEKQDVNQYVNFNRKLKALFDSDEFYDFNSINGKLLFTITWDDELQEYSIIGLTNNTVNDFFINYYSTIGYPSFNDIISNSLMYTIYGDGSETKLFNINTGKFFNILDNIFSFCDKKNKTTDIFNQTVVGVFDENDDIINNMFSILYDNKETEFNEKKTIKFTNCDNIELSVNKNNIADFVYFTTKENNKTPIKVNVENIINNISNEFYNKSNNSFSPQNFNDFLTIGYTRNLIKTILSTLLTPKILFPIAVLRKMTENVIESSKDLMFSLKKFIFDLVRSIFSIFIKKLWSFIKIEIEIFIKKLALKILKDNIQRYKSILKVLISLINEVTSLENCEDIYQTLLNTINKTLNIKTKLTIPGVLLVLSELLPGFSKDRAYVNVIQKLNDIGIPTGDLYGRENKLNLFVKTMIDGLFKEIDENSFVKVANREICIPSQAGPICFPPGIIKSSGKIF